MNIRMATPADGDAITALMIQAFNEDPLMNWFVRQDKNRDKGMRIFYDFMVKSYCLPHSLTWVTGDVQGAALWVPSEKWEPGFLTQLTMMGVIIRAFGLSSSMFKFRERQKIDGRHPKQPHYYLSGLGVSRELRGQGIGTALMQPILDRSDKEGRGCYLETTLERNVGFYNRFSFTVTGTVSIGPEKVTVWLMWRDPQKTGDWEYV